MDNKGSRYIIEDRDVSHRYQFRNDMYFMAVFTVRWFNDVTLRGKSYSMLLAKHYESNLPCADFATFLYCVREDVTTDKFPRRIAHYFERSIDG